MEGKRLDFGQGRTLKVNKGGGGCAEGGFMGRFLRLLRVFLGSKQVE